MEAIQTERLTKRYGRARGIDGLDLTVEEGEFFGFIGPNGAGKSTTIRTLLGLIAPSSGRAHVLGLDVVGQREAILRQVGYLPSETAFYPGMRVRDILRLSAGLRGEDCAREAASLCARFALEEGRRLDELSLGNRKKAAIVCALQHRPRLLVLDEPTSGLDPVMQHVFFEILHERNAEGATVFLSSHVLSEIQHHCHRAAIIREGKLVACDSVDALAGASAKRVTVLGNVDPAGLTSLPGVRDMREVSGGVSFLYGGEMNALLRRLAGEDVRDLTVTEPDLEEVFLHAYGEGRDA